MEVAARPHLPLPLLQPVQIGRGRLGDRHLQPPRVVRSVASVVDRSGCVALCCLPDAFDGTGARVRSASAVATHLRRAPTYLFERGPGATTDVAEVEDDLERTRAQACPLAARVSPAPPGGSGRPAGADVDEFAALLRSTFQAE